MRFVANLGFATLLTTSSSLFDQSFCNSRTLFVKPYGYYIIQRVTSCTRQEQQQKYNQEYKRQLLVSKRLPTMHHK